MPVEVNPVQPEVQVKLTRNGKRSNDQNEFISEELAQKKTKASLSESSGSGQSGSSASLQADVQCEPDVQCDCMTVTCSSE